MRALPADSDAYFADTALGKTASLVAAGAAAGVAAGFASAVFGAGAGFAAGAAGAAGVVAAVVVAEAGVTVASAPHCALRKSFHFWPFSEPSACAALYFVLQSFMLSALAWLTFIARKAVIAAAAIAYDFIDSLPSLEPEFNQPNMTGWRQLKTI
jgi:hypothetical protein